MGISMRFHVQIVESDILSLVENQNVWKLYFILKGLFEEYEDKPKYKFKTQNLKQ